jgi:hypothetical protein
MRKIVGFDYHIKLHHLDYIAREARKNDLKTIYRKLEEFLRQEIAGPTSRKKAATMLMRIWYLVKEEYKELQTEAFALLDQVPEDERLVLHWGMTLLAYSFFYDMAQEIGNAFTLQNEVASELLGRKMKKLYGDKRRVEIATSAVLMSMRAWGVLNSKKHGRYRLQEKKAILNRQLKHWLAKVVIKASAYQAMPLEMIASAGCVFPFQFELKINDLENSGLSVQRQGLDLLMVSLL